MIKEIYGSFKIKRKPDYFINFIKGLYFLYTLPFLIIGTIYYYVTLSNFDKSMKLSRMGKVGKVAIHILANMVSIIFYAYIYRILIGTLELPK